MRIQDRLVGLDLLRGLAAYGVLAAHLHGALSVAFGVNVEPCTGFFGTYGVEIFFALSGFLIGGIMLDMSRNYATPANFCIFLVRRWMRTLPLYYCAMFAYYNMVGILTLSVPGTLFYHLLFLQNILQQRSEPLFFNVSWSLAVEEWFYIALTLSVFCASAFNRRNGFLIAVLSLIVLGLLIRVFYNPLYVLYHPSLAGLRPPLQIDRSVLGRLDAIAYGCLFVYLVRVTAIGPWIARNSVTITGVSFALFVLLYSIHRIMQIDGGLGFVLLYTAYPILSAAALSYFVFCSTTSKLLLSAATFMAAVSYPLYILHNEIVYFFTLSPAHPGTGLIHVVFVTALSTALAYAAHLLIEVPFMRIRPKFVRARLFDRMRADALQAQQTILAERNDVQPDGIASRARGASPITQLP